MFQIYLQLQMEQISEHQDIHDTPSVLSSSSFTISNGSNTVEYPQIHLSPSLSSESFQQPVVERNNDVTDDNKKDPQNAPDSNDISDKCIEQHIKECIQQNHQLFDACCQSENHPQCQYENHSSIPKYLRFQIDVESLIKKLAFYIVLFGSCAFVLYEIIQLYVYTMPIEFTIGTLLCFSFLLNFDMHSLQEFHRHIPVLPIPAFSLSSIFSRYKF
jgi:hypothetical protein